MTRAFNYRFGGNIPLVQEDSLALRASYASNESPATSTTSSTAAKTSTTATQTSGRASLAVARTTRRACSSR